MNPNVIELVIAAILKGQEIASDRKITYGEMLDLVKALVEKAGLKDKAIVQF